LNKRNRKTNNFKDALIGETALINNLILVTDDDDLFQTMIDLGGRVISLEDLLKKV